MNDDGTVCFKRKIKYEAVETGRSIIAALFQNVVGEECVNEDYCCERGCILIVVLDGEEG